MEAAIHTSVIGTKIPCDFTQQLAEECEELGYTGGGRVRSEEEALGLSLFWGRGAEGSNYGR